MVDLSNELKYSFSAKDFASIDTSIKFEPSSITYTTDHIPEILNQPVSYGPMYMIKCLVKEKSNFIPSQYQVQRVIFNPPATIVFWKDKTKTVVKCMEDQEFTPYYGFLAALAKKVYGTNSAVAKIVKEAHYEKPVDKKEKYIWGDYIPLVTQWFHGMQKVNSFQKRIPKRIKKIKKKGIKRNE